MTPKPDRRVVTERSVRRAFRPLHTDGRAAAKVDLEPFEKSDGTPWFHSAFIAIGRERDPWHVGPVLQSEQFGTFARMSLNLAMALIPQDDVALPLMMRLNEVAMVRFVVEPLEVAAPKVACLPERFSASEPR